MVSTRRRVAEEDAAEERAIQVAIQLSLVQSDIRTSFRKTKTRWSSKKIVKNKSVSAIIAKAQNPARVTKRVAEPVKTKRPQKKPPLILRVNYRRITHKQMRKLLKGTPKRFFKFPKKPKDYWPYPNDRFKLGHNSWEEENFTVPSAQEFRDFHKLLVDHHKQFEFASYVEKPAHATESIVTVDVLVNTIFAQSTSNEIAIDAHSRLCNAFPYIVDGKKYAGKIPNYHDIRLFPRDELEKVLEQGGFQQARAARIQNCLDRVYQHNLKRKEQCIENFDHDGNPPNACDFVPGMLSLDYLIKHEDNSDTALLGRLLEFDGIGPKSAMCVMAFAYKRPLFVVDTHVLRMCRWRGWVPLSCTNINEAAMFLHEHVPDDIKYDLHNQIWSHCANENSGISTGRAVLCAVCGARPPSKKLDIAKYAERCPLKDLLPPLEKRWRGAFSMPDVKILEAQLEMEDEDNGTSPDSQRPVNNSISIEGPLDRFFQAKSEIPSSSSQDEILSQQETPSSPQNEVDTKVAKLNLKRKSIRFEEVSAERVQEVLGAGYRLFEFRPIDNTFMEEWGTFDKVSRFKYERPTIMDADVAVTYEYAREVLTGKRQHRWSKVEAHDVATVQATSVMTNEGS